MTDQTTEAYMVGRDALPFDFPTNTHDSKFWEELGRCVATFGHLEMTLAQAHFAFSGMREIAEDKIESEMQNWLHKLKLSIKETLNPLIDMYISAVKKHGHKIGNLDEFEKDLRSIATYRNVLCHAKWNFPGDDGKIVPLFVNKQDLKFDTPIGIEELIGVRKATVDLIVNVINSVTVMGWQFPGSKGPGKALALK